MIKINFLILSFLFLSSKINSFIIPSGTDRFINLGREKMNELHPLDKHIIKSITKFISSTLAGADNTGHNVLHANSQLIHKILESNLSVELKKDLSLFCIKLAQFGDHTGSNILEIYHHFVDKYL